MFHPSACWMKTAPENMSTYRNRQGREGMSTWGFSERRAVRQENSLRSWWKCRGTERWQRGRGWSWSLRISSSGTVASWSPKRSTSGTLCKCRTSQRSFMHWPLPPYVGDRDWSTYSSCEVDGYKQPAQQEHNEQSLTRIRNTTHHMWHLLDLSAVTLGSTVRSDRSRDRYEW